MLKTLITGASGFTGRYLVRHLTELGHEVHSLGPHSDAAEGIKPANHHVADIVDQAALRLIMSDLQPTHVAHLAAISFVAHNDAEEIYRTNIIGTRSLLEACLEAKGNIKSIIVASSANVYGNSGIDPITEDHKIHPTNDYGVSKAAAENIGSIFSDRLPIIITRPFNYTGVGQASSFLVPKIVDHVVHKKNAIELGNLDVARDISDVRSVVEIYGRLLSRPHLAGSTLNICSGRAVSLSELLALAMDISGHRMEVVVNPAFVRSNELKRLRGSPERLVGATGPLPTIPIEETLRWMIEAAS